MSVIGVPGKSRLGTLQKRGVLLFKSIFSRTLSWPIFLTMVMVLMLRLLESWCCAAGQLA